MDKEQAKGKIKEKLSKLINSFPKHADHNEENLKFNYIEPLLMEILGWNRENIIKEQRVLKGRADYILKIGNEEVLVIETKRPNVSLNEEEGRQAVSYAYHRKIKFAVLTNFKEIKVYHALSNIKNIDKNLLKFEDGGLFRISLDQFLTNFDKLFILSKESFEKREINKLLSKKDEKSKKYHSFQSHNGRLSLGQKATILLNCIYGIDLDEKAVELAQLNLLLKLLEDETPESHKRLLPNLRDNIKCGNSLIDDYAIAGDKAFKWEAQFKEVFNSGGFDVVIGNPPYFKIHENDSIKKTEVFNEIKSGMMNISAVFINKALSIMKRDGFVGMIVPKMLAFTESWEKIRQKILKNTSLKRVVDAGKAFDDVLLEQVIFCLNGKISKNNKIVIGQIIENNTIKETAIIDNDLCLKDNKIYLEPEKLAYSIKDKMELGNLRLGNIAEIFLGLGIQGMDNFVEKYKAGYKKALGGNDIQRWQIRGCWYYNKEDKELLKYRKQMEKFYRPKIVAQRIVAHIRDHIKITAAFDEEGVFTFNTVTNFIIKDKIYNSYFILILLNSNLIQYYTYKFIYQNAIRSMDFYEAYAKHIPVPKVDKRLQDKLTSFATELISLNKKISDLKLSGNEKERLEQQIKNIDYEIDQEVYRLYEITKEEQKIIEESLK